MKILYDALGLVAAFCLMLAVLITSVEVVAYEIDGYYEREYRKYQVLQRVPMKMEDLLYVTEEMMEYLKAERADLDIRTEIGGEEREFFNAKEKRHMKDVQELFLGGLRLRRTTTTVALLAAAFLLLKKQGYILFRMLQWGIGLFLSGMAALGLLISTDFTKYFTYFHLIFFDNDDWFLNPKTDLLINIVPEGFFRDTVVLIVLLFFIVSLLLWLGTGRLAKRMKK